MALLVSPHRARALLHRLKHYYGACGPEMVHYAELVRDQRDAAALLVCCERRLENVVRRAGLTRNRWDARRAVVRGHIFVNGRKMTHPGYLVRLGDLLTVRPRRHIETLYRRALAVTTPAPPWLRVESTDLRITVDRLPSRADIDVPVGMAGVVALLSDHQ